MSMMRPTKGDLQSPWHGQEEGGTRTSHFLCPRHRIQEAQRTEARGHRHECDSFCAVEGWVCVVRTTHTPEVGESEAMGGVQMASFLEPHIERGRVWVEVQVGKGGW